MHDASGAGKHHFRDLQTTANDLREAEKTFIPEMQFQVTTKCDNSSGTESKTLGFGREDLNYDERACKTRRDTIKGG